MPIYNARSTQVFLSTAPLDAATTKFRHNRQVPVASDNVQSDTEVLARAAESKTLIESAILDPASNSHMRFLGHHRDAPFFIVRAGTEPMPVQDDGGVSADDVRNGKSVRRQSRAISLAEIRNLQEVEHGRKRTRSQMGRDSGTNVDANTAGFPPSMGARGAPGRPKTGTLSLQKVSRSLPFTSFPADTQVPTRKDDRALCLTVKLSTTSFVTNPPVCPVPQHQNISDIQILVYVNGAFAASTYVPGRRSFPQVNPTDLAIHFTGTRVARMTEKPWIMQSSMSSNSHVKSDIKNRDRWDAISGKLRHEAATLGTNLHNEKSSSADLLETLADVAFPNELAKLGAFGCLDVIITYGTGSKGGTEVGYWTGPARMIDRAFLMDGQPANFRYNALTSQRKAVQHSIQACQTHGNHVPPPLALPPINGGGPSAIESLTTDGSSMSAAQQNGGPPNPELPDIREGKYSSQHAAIEIVSHKSSTSSSATGEEANTSTPTSDVSSAVNARVETILTRTIVMNDPKDSAGKRKVIVLSSPSKDVSGPLAVYLRMQAANSSPEKNAEPPDSLKIASSGKMHENIPLSARAVRRLSLFTSPARTRSSNRPASKVPSGKLPTISPSIPFTPLNQSTKEASESGVDFTKLFRKRTASDPPPIFAPPGAANPPRTGSKRRKINRPIVPELPPSKPSTTITLPTRSVAFLASYPRTGPHKAERRQTSIGQSTRDRAAAINHRTRSASVPSQADTSLPLRPRAREQPEGTLLLPPSNVETGDPPLSEEHRGDGGISKDDDFIPDDLSVDAAIGYAAPGILRKVPKVRGGWFQEAGVLMGCRFIVS